MSLSSIEISHSFDGVHALRNVSFSLRPGLCTALVGPNGAGKTTWLRIASGYLRADHGACHWDGRRIDTMKPFLQPRLGIMRTFQEVRLAWHASAIDNVTVACQDPRWDRVDQVILRRGLHRQAEAKHRAEAEAALDLMRLRDLTDQPASELSYGQSKLLSLACVLARSPRLVLLDEPVAGVQPHARQVVVDAIRELMRRGATVLVIEHDIMFVREVSSDTVVLAGGQVVGHGTTNEVLADPAVRKAFLA